MEKSYLRPIPLTDPAELGGALRLAGGRSGAISAGQSIASTALVYGPPTGGLSRASPVRARGPVPCPNDAISRFGFGVTPDGTVSDVLTHPARKHNEIQQKRTARIS